MRTLVLLTIAILGQGFAYADTLQTESEMRAFADRVMAKVGSGDLAGAFALMKPYTIVPAAEFDAMTLASKAQRDQVGARFGPAVGYEYIRKSTAGESLLKFTYIEKTERHALPWMFYFYHSPKGWVLNSFIWNDRMVDLFVGS